MYLRNNKSKLVEKVFNNVYDKYDLMNDILSFGTHRIWKKKLISWINPLKNNKIIDVAAGTGDIARLCSQATNNESLITCVEPNEKYYRMRTLIREYIKYTISILTMFVAVYISTICSANSTEMMKIINISFAFISPSMYILYYVIKHVILNFDC